MVSYLIGNQELLDEKGRRMQLNYYLMEDNRNKRENLCLYSIQIAKKMYTNGLAEIEKEITPPISYSKEIVEQMIVRLMKGFVTPISMVEIVDDMMGECLIFN